MSTSNVPAIQFTESGLVIPQEQKILSGAIADINQVFGGNLNTDTLETPQGQLATSLAAIVADKNAQFASFVNQINPDVASGVMQDAIGRIYFLTRKPATATVVTAQVVGVAGTVIPAGALAQDTSGNIYLCSGDVTIPASGTIDAEFQCQATGPIPCAAGTLTQIMQTIPGWDAISNSAAGAVGQNVESRADFEYRRKNSVAANAHGSLESVYASVFAVDNVTDVYVTQNVTDASVTSGATSYSLLPHSLYVAAVGGLDAEIAAAIWQKKDAGCNTNGNTTETITDQSGYNYPYPTYSIKFERPSALAIKFAVQIQNNPLLPSDIKTLVKNAIIARFNGTDGGARERIGANIYASRYYGTISLTSTYTVILSVKIGTSTANLDSVSVGIDKYPTVDAANISVTLV